MQLSNFCCARRWLCCLAQGRVPGHSGQIGFPGFAEFTCLRVLHVHSLTRGARWAKTYMTPHNRRHHTSRTHVHTRTCTMYAALHLFLVIPPSPSFPSSPFRDKHRQEIRGKNPISVPADSSMVYTRSPVLCLFGYTVLTLTPTHQEFFVPSKALSKASVVPEDEGMRREEPEDVEGSAQTKTGSTQSKEKRRQILLTKDRFGLRQLLLTLRYFRHSFACHRLLSSPCCIFFIIPLYRSLSPSIALFLSPSQ